MKNTTFLAAALLLTACSASALEIRDGLKAEELIPSAELVRMQKSDKPMVVLDARTQRSFLEKRIAGARLPRDAAYYAAEELFRAGSLKKLDRSAESLAIGMKDVPKDSPVVTYCGTGCGASSVLFYELVQLGFTRVRVLDEGFDFWIDAGYPVASG